MEGFVRRVVQVGLGRGDLVVAEGGPVGRVVTRLVGAALADPGSYDDQRGTIGHGAGRLECLVQRDQIGAVVDVLNMPLIS